VGLFGFGGGGASSQAIDCPGGNPAVANACGLANTVVLTACYSPVPSPPTVGPVSITIEGRLPLYCPDFL
jgi:hypothetical protein